MIRIQKLVPKEEIESLVIDVDKNDLRSLTNLRALLENKDIAANAVLRSTIQMFCNGCICEGTIYIIAGVCFQNGAEIDECSLSCFKDHHKHVRNTLFIMNNVNLHRGVCGLDMSMRNWLASLLNRNDMWEGGILPVPKIYMQEIHSNIYRSVSSGSSNFYEGMIFYTKQVCSESYQMILREIIMMGISCMDLTPILYAVREGGPCMKKFAVKTIEKVEPRDECAREGLIKLGNILERE